MASTVASRRCVPSPEKRIGWIAAIGTAFGFGDLMVAIVTNGFVAFDVMGQWNRTVRAVFDVATGGTLNARRKTSPVEQQDDLSTVVNGS